MPIKSAASPTVRKRTRPKCSRCWKRPRTWVQKTPTNFWKNTNDTSSPPEGNAAIHHYTLRPPRYQDLKLYGVPYSMSVLVRPHFGNQKHRTSLCKSTEVLPQKYGTFMQRSPMFLFSRNVFVKREQSQACLSYAERRK